MELLKESLEPIDLGDEQPPAVRSDFIETLPFSLLGDIANPLVTPHAMKHPVEVGRIEKDARLRPLLDRLDDPVPMERSLREHREDQ